MELNPKQQEAVDYANGPLLIVAGAGSGKTKTLTSRIIKLLERGVKPETIIAITFTNKAAEEMRERIAHNLRQTTNDKGAVGGHKLDIASCPFIGTFHSLGAKILKAESRLLSRTSSFSIFDNEDSLVTIKKVLKELELNFERYKPAASANEISKIKNLLLDPEEILSGTELEIFNTYEKLLVNYNAFDFDDLIQKVVQLFGANEKILEKYQNLYRYILVDEYQDVNPAQYELIRLIARRHRNLNVVGDDAQAIYGWRFADLKSFLTFEARWPKTKVVLLEQNYRSTSKIIAAASELIKNNTMQKAKNLWTMNEEGEPIKIVATENPEEEAEFISGYLAQIKTKGGDQLRRGVLSAILYRTNSQSRAIEQALIQKNIPYQIFGGVKFYERKEVKDVIAGLRLALNPRDYVSAERLGKNLPKKQSSFLIAELPNLSAEMSVLELINFFLLKSNYLEFLKQKFKNAEERIENINELIKYASGFTNLKEFLERVSLLQSTDMPTKALVAQGYPKNHIQLMTIHMAKGLEFEEVFVAGVNEGLLPHQMSLKSLEELEEERRLLYVAMTRAKKRLNLTFFGLPSRFLYELPPGLTEFINLNGDKDALPDEEEIYID